MFKGLGQVHLEAPRKFEALEIDDINVVQEHVALKELPRASRPQVGHCQKARLSADLSRVDVDLASGYSRKFT